MWKMFYQLRSSDEFIQQWSDLSVTANNPMQPVLYQHLTDLIFRILIDDHFKVEYIDQDGTSEITHDEASALRYAAGYILRHVRENLEKGHHELKEELILCLMALTKDRNSEEHSTLEEWTTLIDRGGLWHIKEVTFQLFCEIESETRACLENLTKPSPPKKAETIERIIHNDEVQFYWLISTADFEIDDKGTHDLLLHKIVELFVTMRGYSKAGAWMEKYKQATKQSTQRSKSLRRDLHDIDS